MAQLAHPAPTPTDVFPATGRSRWPLIGAVAGVSGAVATLILDLHPAGTQATDISVVSRISQTTAHLGVIAGFLTVALLLTLAAAWRRHVEPRVPGSTAARLVPLAVTAAAGALTLGYGWRGALAVYLPGGMDQGGFDQTGLYIYYLLNDFGAFIGWLGVVIAAGAVAWMALRERTISRWIGITSLLPVLIVAGFVTATGLPGFQGIVGPIWMIIVFTGLAFGKSTISR